MADWFERVTSNFQECFSRWETVTFSPSKFFSSKEVELDGTALLYYAGVQSIGYALAAFIIVCYFATYYLSVLRSHVGPSLKDTLEDIGTLLIVFAILQSVTILFQAIVSFVAYRALKTNISLSRHFAALLYLSNSEPLTILGLAAFLISVWRVSPVFFLIGLAIVVASKIYYFTLSYRALARLHSLSKRRRYVGFYVGFLPTAATATLFSGVVVFIFAVLMTQLLDSAPLKSHGLDAVREILSNKD
jgi:hypothetical protein